MTAASGRAVTELRVDGGASVMDLLLQLQADQLGVPVARPAVQETTALGAAYLAGLAEGVWESRRRHHRQLGARLEVEPSDSVARPTRCTSAGYAWSSAPVGWADG